MKRMICLLLAMLCVLSLCACVSSSAPSPATAPATEAAPAETAKPEPEAEEPAEPEAPAMPPYEPMVTNYGFCFEYPEEYQNLMGELAWWITTFGNDFTVAHLYYAEVPDEEREDFRVKAAEAAQITDGWQPEWMKDGQYKNEPLFTVLAILNDEATVEYYETVTLADYISDRYEIPEGGGRTSVPLYFDTVRFENGWTLVAQRNQTCTFEGEELPLEQSVGWLDAGYREEALKLLEQPELFVSGLKDAEFDLPGEVGDRIAFETETLQGDKITSEDLFTGHKVTMINLWATWCPPCVGEMPDLEKLNATFAEQDCQIVGVCLDAREERALKEALQILEENGVTYPNVLLSGEMDWANVPAIPTSFFVGEDGTILTEPVVGAYIPGYQQALKEALGKNQ